PSPVACRMRCATGVATPPPRWTRPVSASRSTTRCGARCSKAGTRSRPGWCPVSPAMSHPRLPRPVQRVARRPHRVHVPARVRRVRARHRRARPSLRGRASPGPDPSSAQAPPPPGEGLAGSTPLLVPLHFLLLAHPLHLLEEGGGPILVAVGGQEGEQFLVRFLGHRQVVAAHAVEGETD